MCKYKYKSLHMCQNPVIMNYVEKLKQCHLKYFMHLGISFIIKRLSIPERGPEMH